MTCNIGYKTVSRVVIVPPVPKKLVKKVGPPTVDADLLSKIGEQDEAFVEWLQELDIQPLLEEALKRALLAVPGSKTLKTAIGNDGALLIEGEYAGSGRSIKDLTDKLISRYQMEVMKIIVTLLSYQSIMSETKNSLVLEAEKEEDADVHKYLRIEQNADGIGEMCFEHFDSSESLQEEQQKIEALSEKLGMKIKLEKTKITGSPIPKGIVHKDFFTEMKKNGNEQ